MQVCFRKNKCALVIPVIDVCHHCLCKCYSKYHLAISNTPITVFHIPLFVGLTIYNNSHYYIWQSWTRAAWLHCACDLGERHVESLRSYNSVEAAWKIHTDMVNGGTSR